jgi:hypothetical protein
MKIAMEKQVQAKKQKQVDETFLNLIDESIKMDEKLLKKLAKA